MMKILASGARSRRFKYEYSSKSGISQVNIDADPRITYKGREGKVTDSQIAGQSQSRPYTQGTKQAHFHKALFRKEKARAELD